MTQFARTGSNFRVNNDLNAAEIFPQLPVGNYTVQVDQYGQLYLEKIDSFTPIAKLYGNTAQRAERIMNTFLDRPFSTGVMLSGEKGSGKSLLAKTLSIKGYELGIPTIVINSPYTGDNFNKFLQLISQPCLILFDEFEKTYDKDAQEGILTLLDGVYPSKKMFILTCNDPYRIDRHMQNRPGRIYYMLHFGGVSIEFVLEYCADNLKNKEHTQSVCNVSHMFDAFNFDMLKALVEEMNRYNEPAGEAIRMLNANPAYSAPSKFEVQLKPVGHDAYLEYVEGMCRVSQEWEGNPLASTEDNYICIGFAINTPVAKIPGASSAKQENPEVGQRANWKHDDCDFDVSNIVKIDSSKGMYYFKNEDGDELVLTKKVAVSAYFPAY